MAGLVQLGKVKVGIQTQVPAPRLDARSLPENVFLTVKPGPVHTRWDVLVRAGRGGFLMGERLTTEDKVWGPDPPPVLEGPEAETPKLRAAPHPEPSLPGDALLAPHPLTAPAPHPRST